MSKKLNEPVVIRRIKTKNRICLPPMVLFGCSDERGLVSPQHIEHYRSIAAGGAGLLIVEATCVTKEGRLNETQLGLWEDGQIAGLRALTDAVHREGAPIFVQLHHAGIVGIAEKALCPDAYAWCRHPEKVGVRMTAEDITHIQQAFIDAAVRAEKAGFDGVELHGCHGYLISQFLNSRINHRTDRYGDEPERFVTEIIDGIRAHVSSDFVVGIRLAAFEPALADGLRHARTLDPYVDFLDLSYGFDGEQDLTLPEKTDLKDLHYASGVIKQAVRVPVFTVNGICTPDEAGYILAETDVDMVDIGRSQLVNSRWAAQSLAGKEPAHCLHCHGCRWRFGGAACAGHRLAAGPTSEKEI